MTTASLSSASLSSASLFASLPLPKLTPTWSGLETIATGAEGLLGLSVDDQTARAAEAPTDLRDLTAIITCLARLVGARKEMEEWKLKLIDRAEKAAAAQRQAQPETPASTTIMVAPHIFDRLKQKLSVPHQSRFDKADPATPDPTTPATNPTTPATLNPATLNPDITGPTTPATDPTTPGTTTVTSSPGDDSEDAVAQASCLPSAPAHPFAASSSRAAASARIITPLANQKEGGDDDGAGSFRQ